ncbi:MAG: MXAN_5187 C-terminal domain-containing protein [Myxococcota bacterium]
MGRKEELSSKQIDVKLKEFEQKLERLHRTYEQHFIGIEKRPPLAQRRQVFRLLQELDQIFIASTAQKFRLRAARQRFNSYKSYWNRVQKQIEEGTYHRDKKRARRRQQARERREKALTDAEEQASDENGSEQAQTSGQSEDGAFDMDLDEFEDLDLSAMEKELQDMEKQGEFEKYVGTEKIRRKEFPEDRRSKRVEAPNARQSDGQESQQTSGGRREDKLREIQRKLGISGGGGKGSQDGGDNQFDRSNEGPTRKSRGENPLAPDRGADMSKLQRLRKAKQRIEREREQRKKQEARHKRRVIRRSGGGARAGESQEDKARRVYNNLLEAKRRCNEDTSGLSYDSVKRSMDKQANRLRETKGANNVDFKVVIKDGRAFLKPETK